VRKEMEIPPKPAMGKDVISEKKDIKAPATYKGFVAGVFSGIAKLTVGHP
jgi:hypothetical protein